MSSYVFPKRLGRLGWLARFILLIAVAVAVKYARDYPDYAFHGYQLLNLVFSVIWLIVAFVLLVYSIFYIHLPRCRSLELPPAALVLLFLPPVNALLAMLFLFGGEGYWPRFRASLPHAATASSQPSQEEADASPPFS
jgi:hypothetical protein